MPLRRSFVSVIALLLALTLVAAACGGDDDNGGGGPEGASSEDEGTPTPGGKVVYALEAETTGGYCLPGAQLAIAGAQVAQSVYETLTYPNEDGEYVPYLAKSVDTADGGKTWTIGLREGITFHDGSPLDAEAVKLNIESWRGKNPNAPAPLLSFVFAPIENVEVVDPLTVKVTMKEPLASFKAGLFGGIGRFGIAAPAQLNDKDTCPRNLIGTGPFKFKEWVPNDHLTVVKNENYWREGLPYLDEIEYRPVVDSTQRVNALQAGQVQVMHTSTGSLIDQLQQQADDGRINLAVNDRWAEVAYIMLNVSKPPFDDLRVRQALMYGRDAAEVNTIVNKGVFKLANGPFAEDAMGYVADTGWPMTPDPAKAKALVAEVEKEKGPIRFTYETTSDPTSIQIAQLVQSQAKEIGIDVSINTIEQSQQINNAIAGNFEAEGWRNHPGGDADFNYVWWHSTSPVNFGRIKDPEIDRLLEEGRRETDESKRETIYQSLNKRFAEQAYNQWSWYVAWGLASRPNVKGLAGADLPDGGKARLLAGLHPVSGMWVSK